MLDEQGDHSRDYSLVGREAELARRKGLADARWYMSPIPRNEMKKLMVRRNGPAIRDSLLWFGLLAGCAGLAVLLWGSWWFLLPYMTYAVIYASSSDSRWHESSHGTAFRSDWMNNVLYEISSFMVFRQSTVWRWSHTRHHSDTLVRGRDPEIAAPRPPDIPGIIMNFFALRSAPAEFRKMILHASGKIDREVATYLPESEYRKVYRVARIYLAIHAAALASSLLFRTPFPVMFITLPTLVGSWLMPVYGLTQHAGLAENVLDHRLNCRTVYMNRIHRFLYWNMNYHIEHHMFPMVPYHALPRLHSLMKDDCPQAYRSILHAWKEIVPTLRKQVKDPDYYVRRILPDTSGRVKEQAALWCSARDAGEDGWIRLCAASELAPGEVLRLDLDEQTFALYRTGGGHLAMSEGICTHGQTHLSEGILMGEQIECPKHNGRFSVLDGSPKRAPVCEALRMYEVKEREGQVVLHVTELEKNGSSGSVMTFRVVSNIHLATFIRELVLEDVGGGRDLKFTPGDYLKLEIPTHRTSFQSFAIPEPYRQNWNRVNAFRHRSFNTQATRRNYSLAGNPEVDKHLRFNVRLALPPEGINCDAGVGSSYVFSLRPGDLVKASGPFGDFHVHDSEEEMVFVGGGAGMAPLRSQLSWLFESRKTKRKVSFWYGARSLSELYYEDYFRQLEQEAGNFSFQVAFSEQEEAIPGPYYKGYIHDVLDQEMLSGRESLKGIEFYLCGPPAMISAVKSMLKARGVRNEQLRLDEF